MILLPGKGDSQTSSFRMSFFIAGALLSCLQFVPVIRHKFLWWHRAAGYIVILLVFTSNAGALIISQRAFGGGLDIQGASGVAVVMSTVGICLAYYNI